MSADVTLSAMKQVGTERALLSTGTVNLLRTQNTPISAELWNVVHGFL